MGEKRVQRLNLVALSAVAALGITFVAGFLIGHLAMPADAVQNCRGKKRTNYLTSSLADLINLTNIEKTARNFSSQPHLPGSKRQKELADEIKKRWKEYGLDVEMPEYEVLLSIPDENNPDYIRVVNDQGNILFDYSFVTQAKADPNDTKTWNVPQYFFYSPSGKVKGGLLFVNEGRKEDFDYLKKLNISSCSGSIVMLKQVLKPEFGAPEQIDNAYKCNASGVLFFATPAANETFHTDKNNTYPKTIWLPKPFPKAPPLISGIGDPLTPGLPATKGTYPLDINEANMQAKIPVQLIDYTMARELLRRLKGIKMPDKWKITSDERTQYRIGPILAQNATFHLAVNTKLTRQKIYNVIGTVYGSTEPDHWVLIGNHRDAIAFGAEDPVSGTAGMMELSRAVGKLLKKKWRPRRTIKFCSWAAEESGLIGSTEWVEENAAVLRERAVTYINMDWLVRGNYTLKSNGNPMLTDLIYSQTKLVNDPYTTGKTIYSTWKERTNNSDGVPEFRTSGKHTDYQAFYEFAGVPSLDLQYIAENPNENSAYHTPYDTYHRVKMVDPEFKVHLAQTQLVARLVFNLSNSLLLPFNLTYLSISLENILNRTEAYYGVKLGRQNITLDNVREAMKGLQETIRKFEEIKNRIVTGGENNKQDQELKVQMLNRRMVILNKMFLSPERFSSSHSVRNLLYGISKMDFINNKGITLAAIPDAVVDAQTSGSWTEVKRRVSLSHYCITQARKTLEVPDQDER